VPDVIQSLWIGEHLSPMERLSIASFLRNGHPFHLYVYGKPDGIPEGTVVLDANEILSSSRIFKYTAYDTYAGFSNFFRYKLLLEKGGWWVDTDTVCLKPFEFQEPFVFVNEMERSASNRHGLPVVGTSVLKAPPASALMYSAWAVCDGMNPGELGWGECGPILVGRLVEEFALQQHIQAPDIFCPLHWRDWDLQLKPGISWSFGEQTVAVHLWNELWRRRGADKDQAWPADSLYEQLKRRYL
jgi:Glycosyltransferase sugar-binding region containing DXD motif